MKALNVITLLHVINECYMDIDCASITIHNEIESELKEFSILRNKLVIIQSLCLLSLKVFASNSLFFNSTMFHLITYGPQIRLFI